ncbi:MAG: hypothetical protein R3D63_16110 [Paracoccaceae bacterium]
MMSALVMVLACLPAPVLAGSWTPPAGCEVFLTVQSRQCVVSNHYRCATDPAGDQWRADFDQEGLFFQSRINSETDWVESFDSTPAVRQSLDPNPADPASFTELLASGTDTFDFGLSRDDGTFSRVTGYDRLTGKSFTIDGMVLEQTEFEATEIDGAGTVLRRSRGNEYISRDLRTFFAGPGETDLGDGQWRVIDGSPVQFIHPGETGFATTQPIFDCDAIMSSLQPGRADVWF